MEKVLPSIEGGIALFKDAIEVERAERAQEADSARINAAVEAAENAITALASRQLDPTKYATNGLPFATEPFSPFVTCVTTSSGVRRRERDGAVDGGEMVARSV